MIRYFYRKAETVIFLFYFLWYDAGPFINRTPEHGSCSGMSLQMQAVFVIELLYSGTKQKRGSKTSSADLCSFVGLSDFNITVNVCRYSVVSIATL
jgi:hypothetical protein